MPISSPFKLTLSIDRESYSRSSDSTDNANNPHDQLILDLKLHFRNQTNGAVKLDKDCIHLDSTEVYDSPIVGSSQPLLPDGTISHKGPACSFLANEKLLAIPREEFYETTLKVKIEVVDHGTFHPPQSLGPGEYFLKLTVMTWWEIDGQDDELKEKRRKPGVQVGRYVPSELKGFVVEGKPVKRRALNVRRSSGRLAVCTFLSFSDAEGCAITIGPWKIAQNKALTRLE